MNEILYQVRGDWSLWRYQNTPFSWRQAHNDQAATEYFLGGDAYIYKLRGDGSIWREIPGGSGDLEMLDNNPATRAVTATSLNDDDNSLNVFQLHGDGTIWQYTGTPLTGWQLIDHNRATTAIVSGSRGNLYQMHGTLRHMMLEKGGQSTWAEKDFFFWPVKLVQEIAPPDFLLMATTHGRQHSCGEVSCTVMGRSGVIREYP